MIEKWLQPTLVSLISSVCTIAPGQHSAATEALRFTFIEAANADQSVFLVGRSNTKIGEMEKWKREN